MIKFSISIFLRFRKQQVFPSYLEKVSIYYEHYNARFLDVYFREFSAAINFPCSNSWLKIGVNDVIFSKIPLGLKLYIIIYYSGAKVFVLLPANCCTNSYQQNSTSILMQMLQSDWLSYSYTISHQSAVACRSSTKYEVFIVFPKFWKEFQMQTGNQIPEKTKRRTFTVS